MLHNKFVPYKLIQKARDDDVAFARFTLVVWLKGQARGVLIPRLLFVTRIVY
jgi:hypothetical protein